MEDLCQEGCELCEEQASQSIEYGPIPFRILKNLISKGQKRHYRKLIVHEQLFWDIANHCVRNSESKEQCFAVMRSLITTDISCDHLHIFIWDHPKHCAYPNGYNSFQIQKFPREVIEEMCKVWRVKSIRIEVNTMAVERIFPTWTDKKFFTEFQFHDSHETTAVSSAGIQLEYVEVDSNGADFASDCVFGFEEIGTVYLIANIRRLLPAQHYYFNNHLGCDRTIDLPSRLLNLQSLKKMIEGVWMDGSAVPVTLRLLPYWCELDINFEFPELFLFAGIYARCTVSPVVIHDVHVDEGWEDDEWEERERRF